MRYLHVQIYDDCRYDIKELGTPFLFCACSFKRTFANKGKTRNLEGIRH